MYRRAPDRDLDLEAELTKTDLNSGRREAMEAQMMATLSSIWDQSRT